MQIHNFSYHIHISIINNSSFAKYSNVNLRVFYIFLFYPSLAYLRTFKLSTNAQKLYV